MKKLGFFALVIGVLWVVVAFNTDVSVDTGYGRVNNIGLMASRQNHVIIGGLIVLVGVLMLIFGKSSSSAAGLVKCPFCAELIQPEAIKCKHCGSDISPQHLVEEAESGVWNPSLYYRYENGKNIIVDEAIGHLVHHILESRSAIADLVSNSSFVEASPKELKQKFAPKVSAIANSLPIELRDDFRAKYNDFF